MNLYVLRTVCIHTQNKHSRSHRMQSDWLSECKIRANCIKPSYILLLDNSLVKLHFYRLQEAMLSFSCRLAVHFHFGCAIIRLKYLAPNVSFYRFFLRTIIFLSKQNESEKKQCQLNLILCKCLLKIVCLSTLCMSVGAHRKYI